MARRLDCRVKESLADVVEVSSSSEVLTEYNLRVGNDDPDDSTGLQYPVNLPEEILTFFVVEVF